LKNSYRDFTGIKKDLHIVLKPVHSSLHSESKIKRTNRLFRRCFFSVLVGLIIRTFFVPQHRLSGARDVETSGASQGLGPGTVGDFTGRAVLPTGDSDAALAHPPSPPAVHSVPDTDEAHVVAADRRHRTAALQIPVTGKSVARLLYVFPTSCSFLDPSTNDPDGNSFFFFIIKMVIDKNNRKESTNN